MWWEYFSFKFCPVFHQSALELSYFDQNWAKTRPLLFKIWKFSNSMDSRIVHWVNILLVFQQFLVLQAHGLSLLNQCSCSSPPWWSSSTSPLGAWSALTSGGASASEISSLALSCRYLPSCTQPPSSSSSPLWTGRTCTTPTSCTPWSTWSCWRICWWTEAQWLIGGRSPVGCWTTGLLWGAPRWL